MYHPWKLRERIVFQLENIQFNNSWWRSCKKKKQNPIHYNPHANLTIIQTIEHGFSELEKKNKRIFNSQSG